MTIDRAVRVINFKNNIVLSLSGNGALAALLHPNGRIYQYGSRVEILAHDVHGNNKLVISATQMIRSQDHVDTFYN